MESWDRFSKNPNLKLSNIVTVWMRPYDLLKDEFSAKVQRMDHRIQEIVEFYGGVKLQQKYPVALVAAEC